VGRKSRIQSVLNLRTFFMETFMGRRSLHLGFVLAAILPFTQAAAEEINAPSPISLETRFKQDKQSISQYDARPTAMGYKVCLSAIEDLIGLSAELKGIKSKSKENRAAAANADFLYRFRVKPTLKKASKTSCPPPAESSRPPTGATIRFRNVFGYGSN
jgi:hypothetical protein